MPTASLLSGTLLSGRCRLFAVVAEASAALGCLSIWEISNISGIFGQDRATAVSFGDHRKSVFNVPSPGVFVDTHGMFTSTLILVDVVWERGETPNTQELVYGIHEINAIHLRVLPCNGSKSSSGEFPKTKSKTRRWSWAVIVRNQSGIKYMMMESSDADRACNRRWTSSLKKL